MPLKRLWFIPRSPCARYSFCRPHLYCLRTFVPQSRRARYFIFRALRQCRRHILAHIGHPSWYDWVIWWVLVPRLNERVRLTICVVILFILQPQKDSRIGPLGPFAVATFITPYMYLPTVARRIHSTMEGSTGERIPCTDGCIDGFRFE